MSNNEPYLKMYIAVHDDVPDYMVPTLVAHSVINAHLMFGEYCKDTTFDVYGDWLENSFRKVTVRVNQKEFDKIKETLTHWAGHENTTMNGEQSCLVVLPVMSDSLPNVLKFAKMWAPKVC